jgi:hypothetical protein
MKQDLDKSCHLAVGTRDAVHVPFTVGKYDYNSKSHIYELTPGSFVKFTNSAFTIFVLCEKEESHGILNPFLDEISVWDNVIVFLKPGITTPVVHNFDIDLTLRDRNKQLLEMELEEARKLDPECADCYQIKNNDIIRM